MSEKRIWELLTRQFNKEISEAELKELQTLIQNSGDGNLSSELQSKINLMTFKPDPEDESSKKRSLDAIRKAIGGDIQDAHNETATLAFVAQFFKRRIESCQGKIVGKKI